MREHVAMQQPFAGIVRDKGNVPNLAALKQRGVSQSSEASVSCNLVEMHAMQVHRVREGGVVGDLDPDRFAP